MPLLLPLRHMAIYYPGHPALKNIDKPVITIGTFDGVHLGHRAILEEVITQAKKNGGQSMVITFDPHPRSILHIGTSLRILTPLEQKLQLIQKAGIDNIVVAPFSKEFALLTAEAYVSDFLVKEYHPSALVIGYDHRFGHDREGDISLLKSFGKNFGFDVDEIPAHMIRDAAISSTKIRDALNEGNISAANQMLGRNYSISGTVVKGQQLGRTLGYPTANLQPKTDMQLIPASGIYAAQVRIADRLFDSVMSIGVRPTVTDNGALSIEAFLFDFSGDLYGQEIEISFVERIRREEKFDSLETLKAAMAKDEREAREILKVKGKR
ncbi:MAG: bifunctional riboflavin kinase/FAD synthetase [Chitinophagaceae bacterium]